MVIRYSKWDVNLIKLMSWKVQQFIIMFNFQLFPIITYLTHFGNLMVIFSIYTHFHVLLNTC